MGVGPYAYALFWAMLSYSNHQLLDGHLTRPQVESVARLRFFSIKDTSDAIDDLTGSGMWEVEEDGYHIHDYLDYNDSKEDILARRSELSEIRRQAGQVGGIRSGEARRSKTEANAKQNRSKTEANTEPTANQNGSKHEAPVPDPESPVLSADNTAADAAPLGVHERYVTLLQAKGANRAGILASAHQELFGRPATGVSRLAGMASKYHAGKMLDAMFEALPHWNRVDDPLDYLEKIMQHKVSANGATNGVNRHEQNYGLTDADVAAQNARTLEIWTRAHEKGEL